MRAQRTSTALDGDCEEEQIAEQSIMVRLLHNDTPEPWTRAELERDLDAGALPIQDALANLRGLGVININGELVTVSKAARRMFEIDQRC